MKKIAVVYWSGTGNTEAMAKEIAGGVADAGGEAVLLTSAEFSPDLAAGFDKFAFGCPSMGAEQLEDSEFEPMFGAVEKLLSGKEVALFGSYGWGDGQWMREWQERCSDAGMDVLGGEGLTAHETPDADAVAKCRALGRILAE